MDYTKLTISELIDKCKKIKIKGYCNKKKEEVIQLLQQADTDNICRSLNPSKLL